MRRFICVLALLGCATAGRLLQAEPLQLYTEDYRPFSYYDNGVLTGMAVEVVELLMQRTATSATIELVPWTRGYHQVQQQANTALFSTVRTPGREASFQWVGPIATGHTSIYSHRDAGFKVRTLQDVERFNTLAVPKQWYSYEYLRERGVSNLYGVPSPQHMVKMFKHRRIALLVANDLALAQMLAQQGLQQADVELQFTFMDNHSYIAFSKQTDPAVVERWQWALEQLKQDGSLQRIHQRWFAAIPVSAAP